MQPLHAVYTPIKQHMFNPVTWKQQKKKKGQGKEPDRNSTSSPLCSREGTYRVGHFKDIPHAMHSGRNTFPKSRAPEEHETETAADGDKGHHSNL